VLSVLLLIAAGVAAWFAYTKIQDQLNNSKPVPVPSVIGLDVGLAKNKLIAHGFVPNVKASTSETVPKGVVFFQNPPGGSKLAKNNPVQITVSTGPPEVPVPNVIGKNRDDAVATLSNAGLTYQVVSVHSGKPPDTVTGQFPHAGSKVQINVSSGPQPVSVPYVVGQSFDQASATLQNAGFGVKRTNVQSDQPADTVVSQNPTGSAAPGASITLSVSKGPKQANVPDVTSQDETSATDALHAAGFKVQVQHQTVTDPSLDGIVISETPHGGTKAPQGSTVTIVVGQIQPGPPPSP
jgi:serine/threonine-protein kinase